VTICDSGPLFSLIDPRQQHHARCAAVVESLIPLVTTWPCLTETMYFLGRSGQWRLQEILWNYLDSEIVQLHELSSPERSQMRATMQQYHDLPMDMADASLVAVADALGLRRIFTLDSDFRVYRTADGGTFEIVPD
jgi:predicted nucleic acid-binding protein